MRELMFQLIPWFIIILLGYVAVMITGCYQCLTKIDHSLNVYMGWRGVYDRDRQ
jgi:hypothetical protein